LAGPQSSDLTGGTRPSRTSEPFRFFSSSSFWNEAVPADAAVETNSAAAIAVFGAEVVAEEQLGSGPWINAEKYSVPIYTVPANETKTRVILDGLHSEPALQAAWEAVPLPADAQPARGSDATLVVWQPSTDRLWEFEHLVHRANGWHASWGGAMQNVSSETGVYGPEAWPGAKSGWGVSASSLSIAGGLITLEDLERGEINHALALAIPNVRAGVYASPAQRSDGLAASPLALPEGAHLRLNPSLNLSTLHLPRLTLMIAEAAQRYGIFVRDKGANIQFYAQDPIPTGTEPYAGATGYFEGESPAKLLASFPWSQLELLKMELQPVKHFRERPQA
jgi:hypothetical protein